jgi:hypothetical protein
MYLFMFDDINNEQTWNDFLFHKQEWFCLKFVYEKNYHATQSYCVKANMRFMKENLNFTFMKWSIKSLFVSYLKMRRKHDGAKKIVRNFMKKKSALRKLENG